MSKLLYHASPQKGLTKLTPQRTLSKNEYIGNFIFATPDKRMASMYLAPREGGALLINSFDGEPYAVINNASDSFKKVDKGGAVYAVSSEAFTDTPQKELAGTELVSRDPVTVMSSEEFETSLEAMEKSGVKVYFLNDELFHKVQNAKDHGWEILSHLKPYNFR